MRVSFQEASGAKPATTTNYQNCHPPASVTFEIAGMYPSTAYTMFSQTNTGGTVTNGPPVTFTAGALPTATVPFPRFTVLVPPTRATDTADSLVLINPVQFGEDPVYANVAADLAGKIMWYYNAGLPQSIILTRPLANATMLTIQSEPTSGAQQFLRQIDLAGNLIKETNTDAISTELLAMGVTDGGFCTGFAKPAPVGSACLGSFNHDAIQTLPNGDTAVLASVEKIFPPGTQGDTTGLPVDIVGEMILVLNTSWQVVWYFDAFEHDSGAPQLDITRAAVLGETCVTGQAGCPPMYLLSTGISPLGKDWLHSNTLYYWPLDGDIIWSSRHQDWIMKVDYNDGTGTANILWRLGPCGDFTFNNTYNDPWPWNSHQHDVGIQNNGNGPITMFDNGNTRVSPPGASTGCIQGVGSGDSRGMALTFDESTLQVNPVLSVDMGVFSTASGSAQLLSNGTYFYVAAVVLVDLTTEDSYSIDILPTAGTDTGKQVLNLQSTDLYRGWQMPSLYTPPIT
jgi:hypothetical protein